MKNVTVKTWDKQVAISCLGGCLLLIGWVAVGVINVVLSERLGLGGWQLAIFVIVWVVSLPIGSFLYVKWRGLRHKKAFLALERKMSEKTLNRLRQQSPDSDST